eukprot:c17776_g1_i1 orf=319-705(-)
MVLTMVDASLHDFDSVLSIAETQGHGILLLLFLGDRVPSIGHSWCPDCVRAEPVIYQVLETSDKPVTLLRAYVGDKSTWQNVAHPWRHDERFQLKGVPTLIRWEIGAISLRLEDNEAHLEANIKKLLY